MLYTNAAITPAQLQAAKDIYRALNRALGVKLETIDAALARSKLLSALSKIEGAQ